MTLAQGSFRGKNDPRPLPIDKISNNLVAIETEHSSVHDGDHYTIKDFASLNTGVTTNFIIETPAAPVAHFKFNVASMTGAIDIEFRETVVAASDGTAITPVNNNRISTKTSSLVFRRDPTGITDGTSILTRERIGSGTNPSNRLAGVGTRNEEFVLKPSTKYQVKIVNQAGAANVVQWEFSYYEYNAYN